MRTEISEKEVQEEVFKRNFLYGSGVQDANLIGLVWTRLKAKEAVFRPQCGINACPTMAEMYENQAPEVGAVLRTFADLTAYWFIPSTCKFGPRPLEKLQRDHEKHSHE